MDKILRPAVRPYVRLFCSMMGAFWESLICQFSKFKHVFETSFGGGRVFYHFWIPKGDLFKSEDCILKSGDLILMSVESILVFGNLMLMLEI